MGHSGRTGKRLIGDKMRVSDNVLDRFGDFRYRYSLLAKTGFEGDLYNKKKTPSFSHLVVMRGHGLNG